MKDVQRCFGKIQDSAVIIEKYMIDFVVDFPKIKSAEAFLFQKILN